LGIILLIIGFIAKVAILWTVGIVLLVVGAVLMAMGSMGRLSEDAATTTDHAAPQVRIPDGSQGVDFVECMFCALGAFKLTSTPRQPVAQPRLHSR